MKCRACKTQSGLELCPHCGHHFCGNHRGTLDGDVACTTCLRKEHERKSKAKQAKEAREKRLAKEKAASENRPDPEDELPMAPLPEPPGKTPYVMATIAAGVTGTYGKWFFSWLGNKHDLPGWLPLVLTILVAAAAGLGVWAIVKTRRS